MYRTFGDSITDGTGASEDSKKWRNILSSSLGVQITNFAHGGDMAGDQTNEVYSALVNQDDVSIITLGVNDQRIYGENSTKMGYFIDCMRNHIVWLSLINKQTARSVGGETGTWSNTGILGIGRASTSVGSTKTFTVSGTTVYVSLIVVDTAGAAGTYEVYVDDSLIGAYNSTAAGVTTYNGYPYAERLHRITGLTQGNHTVRVKMTGPSNLYVQWAGGNDQPAYPKVYVGNVIKANGYQWGGSLSNVQSYNQALSQLVQELKDDGLDVTLVDLYSVVDPAVDLHADNLHPIDSGHAKIAEAFRLSITDCTQTEPEVTFNEVSVFLGSDGFYYVGDTSTKVKLLVES